jgi:putative FmdB family regulatory protein
MTIYEYLCKDCRELFEITSALVEQEHITCPKCGNENVQQAFATFYSTEIKNR